MYIYTYTSTVYFALHMQFTLASFTFKLSRKPKIPHHVAAFLLALDLPKEAQKLHNLAQKAEELIEKNVVEIGFGIWESKKP